MGLAILFFVPTMIIAGVSGMVLKNYAGFGEWYAIWSGIGIAFAIYAAFIAVIAHGDVTLFELRIGEWEDE